MTWTLRWGRVSHRRTYGTPVKTAITKSVALWVNVAFCRSMQEKMFPICTNLTHGNLIFVPNTEPQNRGTGFMQSNYFWHDRWRH